MTTQHIHTFPQAMPRAAASRPSGRGADFMRRLARVGEIFWVALEANGRARADRELLAMADRWQSSKPKLARELRSYVSGGSTY